MRILNSVLVLLLIGLWATCSVGAESQNSIFSFKLEPGWVEIPADVLTAQRDNLQANSISQIPNYPAAYQGPGGATWFDLPYVVVDLNRDGKIPLEEFKKAASDEGRKEIGDAMQEGMDSIELSKLELEADPVVMFDQENEIIWTAARIDMGGRPATMMSAIFRTETGFLSIIGYSRQSEEETFQDQLSKMVLSVKLKPQFVPQKKMKPANSQSGNSTTPVYPQPNYGRPNSFSVFYLFELFGMLMGSSLAMYVIILIFGQLLKLIRISNLHPWLSGVLGWPTYNFILGSGKLDTAIVSGIAALLVMVLVNRSSKKNSGSPAQDGHQIDSQETSSSMIEDGAPTADDDEFDWGESRKRLIVLAAILIIGLAAIGIWAKGF